MKDASSPQTSPLPSPQRFPKYDKQDAEDRLATRNSLQMTTEEEGMEGRRSKPRKLQVMMRSQRQKKPTASMPILKDAEPIMTVLPDRLNQNQRITFQKQSTKHHEHQAATNNKAKRNKIFSQKYLHKRYSLQLADGFAREESDLSSTKRLSLKLQSVSNRLEGSSQMEEGCKKWQRGILHEINSNSKEDFPTVIKDRCESNKADQAQNILISHPKFTHLVSNQSPITRGPAQSHIFRCSTGKTHQMIFGTEQGEKHANPASKKIRHGKTKTKSPKSSFSKLTLGKYHSEHFAFGVQSRSSHCLLPECLIKDSLTNYNIKVESCSSEGQQRQRYFDTEESPIKQKISYRNIDIPQSNIDDAVLQDETRHHNLFSDFECPASPKKEHLYHKSNKELTILRSTRKIAPQTIHKCPYHIYLIGVALLLLVIQMAA